MKMKKFVFVLSIFLSLEIIAQNLITNPSFEIISSCPDDMGQVWHATGWNHAFKFTNASGIINNPSLSASCSTDLFASCSSCAAFNFQPLLRIFGFFLFHFTYKSKLLMRV
jgi:hypothetical protein